MSEASNLSFLAVKAENKVSFAKVEAALSELINELNPPGFKPQKPYFNKVLEHFKEFMIRDALQRRNGVQITAAKQLGMNRNTIKYNIKKYGIDRSVKKSNGDSESPTTI